MDLGLLQKEIGVILGVSGNSVFHWETGVSEPAIRFWPKIVEFLGGDPSPAPRTLAEGLKAARRRLGCSQKKLAGKINVDPTSISRWEKGRAIGDKRCGELVKDLLAEFDIEVR